MKTQISKNPHVQAAAIALLAVNRKHVDVTDEYGEKAGWVIDQCLSAMGLPSGYEKATPRQQARLDAATDIILELAGKMERALGTARLLSGCN
jgi:hypothetical protein